MKDHNLPEKESGLVAMNNKAAFCMYYSYLIGPVCGKVGFSLKVSLKKISNMLSKQMILLAIMTGNRFNPKP